MGLRLAIMQAFIHLCIPIFKFLGHVIHFLQICLNRFMELYFKNLCTFFHQKLKLTSFREGMSKNM
jgi:hypothetical protein